MWKFSAALYRESPAQYLFSRALPQANIFEVKGRLRRVSERVREAYFASLATRE